MMIHCARFNTYLWLTLGLLLFCGCSSGKDGKDAKKNKKVATILELHQEVSPDAAGESSQVAIGRDKTFKVNVDDEAFLDGGYVSEAKLIDEDGGLFAIQLHFDFHGSLVLQTYTARYANKRIAVLCVFGDRRWVAAPVTSRMITDGVFTFTPDATHEEAERIVKGLNDVAKELQKRNKF